MDSLSLLLERFVDKECAAKILSLSLNDISCHKLLISKLLGVVIVVGSSILKVPQIAKILSSGSANGISFSSYLLETLSCTIGFIYNYRRGSPFTTYGEGAFILLQNLFIMFLMFSFKKKYFSLIGLLGVYATFTRSLLNDSMVNNDLMLKLQWSTLFIGISSRLPQIWDNFTNKSTGQLSLITTFLQFAGSAARVFTTVQEVSDPSILTGFIVMTSLNGIVLSQILLYWKTLVNLPQSLLNPKKPKKSD